MDHSLARSIAFLLCTSMLLCSPAASRAQRFSLYAYAFMSADRQPSIQVNTSIVYSNLIFFKKDKVYESAYEIYLRVKDHTGRVVDTAVLKKKVTASRYRDTQSARLISKASKSFAAAPGAYTLEAAVAVKNTQLTAARTVSIDVPDFLASGIGVGAPRLCAVPRNGGFTHSSILRGDAIEETLAVDTEGISFADLDRAPAIRFEIYAAPGETAPRSCKLYVEVTDGRKNQLFYSAGDADLAGRGDSFLLLLDVDDWEPGEYKMAVKAVMDNPRREASSSFAFKVEFTRAMLGTYFDDTLAMLAIIASPDEYAELKQAPAEDRLAAWRRFWKKRDPSAGSETNEVLVEFLSRVRYARDNFSTVEPGWKTDRGRVYIRYGPPDQMESTIASRAQGEYQIWRYNDLNLVFVFYDRFFGVGDFRLIGTDAY